MRSDESGARLRELGTKRQLTRKLAPEACGSGSVVPVSWELVNVGVMEPRMRKVDDALSLLFFSY